jgi:hypothetical protein
MVGEKRLPCQKSKHIQEVAKNFKERGNDYFKGKRYREALGFYTQGVDAQPTDPALKEALLCNRAACNLELSTAMLPRSRFNLNPMSQTTMVLSCETVHRP